MAKVPTGNEMVRGVKVFCNGDRTPAPFVEVEVAANDPVFTSGEVCPVFAKLGLKIMAKRVPPSRNFSERERLDNQISTHMMIDTESGFAAPVWQSHVGNVIFVRKDKKPLTLQHFEALWMFNDSILELFGESDSEAHGMMSRKRFDEFWDNYKSSQMSMIKDFGDRQDEVDAWERDDNPFTV